MTAETDDLWEWALEDAGLTKSDVVLIAAAGPDDSEFGGRFMPSGDRKVTGLDPETLALVADSADHPRVVVPAEPRQEGGPAALLALMRFHLEFARHLLARESNYVLTLQVQDALSPVFAKRGRGGGVVWNAIPLMRSANAAAAALVSAKIGPQLGRLHHPLYGPMFRLERAPLTVADLPRQTTVFAALWPEAFEAHVATGATSAEGHLESLSPRAGEWWRLVSEDELFGALSRSAEAFTPTPEEIEQAPQPADAWRPLEGLIDRALSRGLSLTQS